MGGRAAHDDVDGLPFSSVRPVEFSTRRWHLSSGQNETPSDNHRYLALHNTAQFRGPEYGNCHDLRMISRMWAIHGCFHDPDIRPHHVTKRSHLMCFRELYLQRGFLHCLSYFKVEICQ